MNKKGFVLMETIVVIVVISVALLTIFSSYNKILRKTKAENKYDTSEYIYMTEHVKKYLSNYSCTKNEYEMGINSSATPMNHFSSSCGFSVTNHPFNIKGIYLVKSVMKAKANDLEKFNANMIDYIRKLDVGENDTLIIVEYQRPAKNWDGNDKVDSNEVPLYETYIASLEWS